MAVKKLTTYGDPLLDRQIGEIVRAFTPSEVIEVALTSPWTNFGSAYFNAGYYKQLERVYLRGLVVPNTAVSASTIFTLPDGYYPTTKSVLLPSMGSASSVYVPVTIQINTLGTVSAHWTSGSTPSWIELDGLSFRVAG